MRKNNNNQTTKNTQKFGRPLANNRSSLKMLNLFLVFTFTPETLYGSVV